MRIAIALLLFISVMTVSTIGYAGSEPRIDESNDEPVNIYTESSQLVIDSINRARADNVVCDNGCGFGPCEYDDDCREGCSCGRNAHCVKN